MTGTGIVALAGIVVNNNIVLIDTYQEYARYMPRDRGDHPHRRGAYPARFADHDHHHGGACADDVSAISARTSPMAAIRSNNPTALWWKQLGHRRRLRPRHRDGA